MAKRTPGAFYPSSLWSRITSTVSTWLWLGLATCWVSAWSFCLPLKCSQWNLSVPALRVFEGARIRWSEMLLVWSVVYSPSPWSLELKCWCFSDHQGYLFLFACSLNERSQPPISAYPALVHQFLFSAPVSFKLNVEMKDRKNSHEALCWNLSS